jgi:hypothetical protein
MRKPEFITFTGADCNTSIEELQALAEDYPVEFGILLSKTRAGTPRYPRQEWIDLVRASGLRLSMHICGEWAQQAILGAQFNLQGFERAQINMGTRPRNTELIRQWGFDHDVEPVLQCRGPFPVDRNVSWLYDPSGGTGERPDMWPIPHSKTTDMVGYAGGIGPDNVAQVLVGIGCTIPYWIDMESSLRDEAHRFSVAKCRAVCEAVYGTPWDPR